MQSFSLACTLFLKKQKVDAENRPLFLFPGPFRNRRCAPGITNPNYCLDRHKGLAILKAFEASRWPGIDAQNSLKYHMNALPGDYRVDKEGHSGFRHLGLSAPDGWHFVLASSASALAISSWSINISSLRFISFRLGMPVNSNFLVFSVSLDDMMGQSFALLVPTVAAAESAIGLAIFVITFRTVSKA